MISTQQSAIISMTERWGYALSNGAVAYLRSFAANKPMGYEEAIKTLPAAAANMLVVCGLLNSANNQITDKGLQYLNELDAALSGKAEFTATVAEPIVNAQSAPVKESIKPTAEQAKIIRQIAKAPRKVFMSSILIKLGSQSFDQMTAQDWICADSEGKAYATRYGKEAVNL